jgi:hypothetical protein
LALCARIMTIERRNRTAFVAHLTPRKPAARGTPVR